MENVGVAEDIPAGQDWPVSKLWTDSPSKLRSVETKCLPWENVTTSYKERDCFGSRQSDCQQVIMKRDSELPRLGLGAGMPLGMGRLTANQLAIP